MPSAPYDRVMPAEYPSGAVGWFPPGFFTPGPTSWRSQGGPPSPVPRDPELVWRNPTYTIPGILQAELRGYWNGTIQQLFWTPGAPGGLVVAQASFSSPLFDLRPELRGSAGYAPEAQSIFRGGAYGAGAKCLVQFNGLQTITEELRVFSVEEAHVVAPPYVRGVQTPQDITEQFFDGGTDVILEWEPPGNPVRYWRVNLFIQQVSGAFGDHPKFTAVGVCQ